MDEFLTNRRSAVAGIVAAIAALQAAGSLVHAQDGVEPIGTGASVNSSEADSLSWASDGTRDLLSSKLDTFFGSSTGTFNVVRSMDEKNLQGNGEYLLADQVRLPLYGVASSKVVESDGSIIYEAFVNRNPAVDTFIKLNPTGDIEGVALAGTQDIVNNGRVVGIVPIITIFFRQTSVPADLQARAEEVMKDHWSRGDPYLVDLANKIKVVAHKLP